MMKSLSTLFTLSLLLSGCGDDASHTPKKIDEEFQPFVDLFLKDATEHGRTLDSTRIGVTFFERAKKKEKDTTNKIEAGECSEEGMIYIREETFQAADFTTRQIMLYHELGHCLLSRDHLNEMTDQFGGLLPKSLMHENPLIIGQAFPDHRDYYTNELFGKAN